MARSNLQQLRVLELAQREQGQVEVALFWNRFRMQPWVLAGGVEPAQLSSACM
jgi:hypothetical protein